ncbi:MAG: hypothetical protein HAW67_03045 [Endozoicomonadaceae bacterium]|nr:hypothetical protein [Endozoicomonadaceae bacterium]
MNQKLYYTAYRPLHPLTGILLNKGITFHETAQILKQVYVAVAEQQLLQTKKGKATTSRMAITTGLTRKDVATLRKTTPKAKSVSTKYNRAIRVTNGWQEDKEFCTSGGFPAVLPINGKKRSFEALVNRYSGDMTTKAMLDELIATQVLTCIENKYVSLQRDVYPLIEDENEDEIVRVLGRDVSLLMTTISHNMTHKKEDLWFQRKVSYDNLPTECLKKFRTMVKNNSQILLEKSNEWLPQHNQDSKPNAQDNENKRAGVGIYYFEEDRLN